MTAKLTVSKDRLDEVLKSIHSLTDQEVVVGFPETTANNTTGPGGKREGDINNPSLAYLHEFGSPANNIPARPFLVPGVATVRDQVAAVLVRGVKKALAGDKNACATALQQAGLVAQGAVQQKIVDGPFVPNAPMTIALKGSSRPLIDTGAMRQAVSYVVRKRKG